MKKFSEFLKEEPMRQDDENLFVTVKNGSFQLRSATAGPYGSYGKNVVMAVIQGDLVVATLSNGVTQIFKLNRAQRTVVGPVRGM